MFVLDTDHLTELQFATVRGNALREKIAHLAEDVVTTIVSAEEIMRGWLAEIHRQKNLLRQVPTYQRLGEMIDELSVIQRLPFDVAAAELCRSLRTSKLRIGTLDLKIAAISLVNNAKLVTGNRRDFEQVPGLLLEDWIGQ